MSAAIKPLGAALLGARGYVGAELIALLEDHPALELVAASSRAMEGQPVKGVLDDAQRRGLGGAAGWPRPAADGFGTADRLSSLAFENMSPEDCAARVGDIDVWFLALPNGLAAPFVEALTASPAWRNGADASALRCVCVCVCVCVCARAWSVTVCVVVLCVRFVLCVPVCYSVCACGTRVAAERNHV